MKPWTIFIIIMTTVVLVALMFFVSNLGEKVNSGVKDVVSKTGSQTDSGEKHFCSEESRRVEACSTIYSAVCGWFDPARVQCVKYPCAQTYSSACNACVNQDVLYWTAGECPTE